MTKSMKKGSKLLFAETALNAFIRILKSDDFRETVDISSSRTSTILKWIVSREDETSTKIKNLMSQKNRARKTQDFRSMFKEGPPELIEIGTEQNKQIFKLAYALVLYSSKDRRVLQVYDSIFRDRAVGVSLVIGTKYIPSKCARYNTSRDSKFDTKVPKSFEILIYFHALRYVVKRKKETRNGRRLAVRQDFKTGNRIGFVVQIIVNAWSSLARAIQIENCEAMISPYIMFDISKAQFRVLSNRTDGFAPLSQMRTYQEDDRSATCEEESNSNAWNRANDADGSFRFLAQLFFEHIHELVLHDELYEFADNEGWTIIDKYRFRKGAVASVFETLPIEVMNALGYKPKYDCIDVDEIHSGASIGTESNKKRTLGEEQEDERQVTSGNKAKKKRRTEKGNDLKLYKSRTPQVVKQEDTISSADDEGQVDLPRTFQKVDSSDVLGKNDISNLKAEVIKAMRPVCRVHDVCFRELVETDADETGSFLNGTVQLIITDPPQSTGRNRNKKSSFPDILTNQDMEECVDMFADILKPGGHGIVFCSAKQFGVWHNLLRSCSGDESHGSDSESNSSTGKESGSKKRKRRVLFSVEDAPIYFVQAPGHHLNKTGSARRHHISVVEMAIHFWKRGLSLEDEKGTLDYSNQGYIQSRHAPCTNCIDEINPIGKNERVRVRDTEGSSFKHLRPEQKSLSLLQELVGRYTQPGDIVVDCFAGTLVTAKACLEMEKHRIFVGCDRDSGCVEDAMPLLLKTFVDQARNSKSDLSLSQETQISLLRYIEKVGDCKTKNKRSKKNVWNAPPGLPMYQRLPAHIRRFLSCITNDTSFYLEQKRNRDRWLRETPAILDTIPTEVLLGVEAAAKSCIVAKSTIRHPNAGRGVFATRTIAKHEEVLTYYGTVVYSDLGVEKAKTKSYGNGVLGIRKGHFQNRAIELRSHALDSNGVEHNVFIVPAPFCVASYINDPRYLSGDEEESMHQNEKRRVPNVRFLETTPSDRASRNKLGSNRLVCIEALRQIHIGEELFVDYGAEFASWSSN